MTTAPCITVSSSSRSSLGSPAATSAAIPTVSSSNQLSQLSRNASVLSTSSSSSASSLATTPPSRPRPLRQFSYQPPSRPRSPSEGPNRSRPRSPTTPRAARAPPPVWVPRDLGRADSDDSDSALPELVTTSRRGSDARTRAHSRKGSASTVRRPDMSEPRTHSRSDSASSSSRPVLVPPASPKTSTNLLAGSPKLGPRALVAPGKRSRVPSTASSAAVLAGQLEAVARELQHRCQSLV
ncbi:hypothetical protein BDV93DRAFT_365670 [Ceratobasidium sp. AG-I]|nr:hypothetical protein BDV93DRAFT_365670 [Ceratobasidium sp. AG-I]